MVLFGASISQRMGKRPTQCIEIGLIDKGSGVKSIVESTKSFTSRPCFWSHVSLAGCARICVHDQPITPSDPTGLARPEGFTDIGVQLLAVCAFSPVSH
jgi:hypothetical protein